MIEGIISTILATIFLAGIAYLYRHGYITEGWVRILQRVSMSTSYNPDKKPSIKRFRRSLIRRLIHDQSIGGIHHGQFGKSTSLDESAKYQKNPEELSIKPRLYLTFWPGVVLKSHHIAPRAIRLATIGIKKLYQNNRITVRQTIGREMLPQKEHLMVSYRHTMCGARFLYHQLGWNSISRAVIDLMLDQRNAWQNADGGWAHSNRDVVESDLWGSVYAMHLLDLVVQNIDLYSDIELNRAEDSYRATMVYLQKAWQSAKWSYGAASSEENAVLLFIEVAELLQRNDPDFHNEVKRLIKSWLSPSGDLSETYLAACHDVSPDQLYARMAYALFRGQDDRSAWSPLFEWVVRDGGDTLNSADMAFMIDLSYEYYLRG